MSRIFAVIPAAGKSTRMGRTKLALPLGNRSVIERVVDALRQGGVEHILVVVAPHVPELMTLARAAGAHVLMLLGSPEEEIVWGRLARAAGAHVRQLPGETADMRETVEAGLDWLEEIFAPQLDDLWLLVPGDHPVLDPDVIRQLLATRAAHRKFSIVLPAYAGHRGHPALIDWKHVARMRTMPAGQGINTYLQNHTDETYELLVDSPTVLMDLDTPTDYEHLQESLGERKRAGGFWLDLCVRLWLFSWFFCIGAILGYLIDPFFRVIGGVLLSCLARFVGATFFDKVVSAISSRLLSVWQSQRRTPDVPENAETFPKVLGNSKTRFWLNVGMMLWFTGSGRAARLAGVEALDIKTGEKVLEIGFGTGDEILDLAKLVGPQGKVCGIDISAGMLTVAQRKVTKEALETPIDLRVGDARQLPFADGSFDTAYSSFTLELFPDEDVPVVLAELRRVLRPGGRLAVVSMAKVKPGNKASVLERTYVCMHRLFPHIVDCRLIDVLAVVAVAGFRVLKQIDLEIRSMPVVVVVAEKRSGAG